VFDLQLSANQPHFAEIISLAALKNPRLTPYSKFDNRTFSSPSSQWFQFSATTTQDG
jgi:hypothetical protein